MSPADFRSLRSHSLENARDHSLVEPLRSPRARKCSLFEPLRSPRSSKMLALRASSKPRSLHRVMLFELVRRSGATLERACSKKRAKMLETTRRSSLFEAPEARKCSRELAFRASSKRQSSKLLEKDARRSGRSSGRRRFEALSKPLASKRLSWKRLR